MEKRKSVSELDEGLNCTFMELKFSMFHVNGIGGMS